MAGLDSNLLKNIDYKRSILRAMHDINSDFIYAPHYACVFEHADSGLWDSLKTQLNKGDYNPQLPITIEVPKKSGLTRPGAILNPIDRLLFQILIDEMAEDIESEIDRNKVFSNVYKPVQDGSGRIFESSSNMYLKLQNSVSQKCDAAFNEYVIATDIACYFERIYQHVLINLLRSTSCKAEYISLLEKVLSAHTAKDSHGIIQGSYPTDVLGNYYLCSFDTFLTTKGIDFVRYVDDYWMFFHSKEEAIEGLSEICKYVRKEGLYLNEYKTKVMRTSMLKHEETEIDVMFGNAKAELLNNNFEDIAYNFDPFDVKDVLEDVELKAVEELYNARYKPQYENLIEKIDKFCLPRFANIKSPIAINDAIEGLLLRPHLSSIYITYLKSCINNEDASFAQKEIENLFLNDKLCYDWQKMWIAGMFYSLDNISSEIPIKTTSMLGNSNISPVLRAICALVSSKHGDGSIRRMIRNSYSSEPSNYVKEAILYSTKHFPSIDDRNACTSAWGNHSKINELIVLAMKEEVKKQGVQ